MLDHRIGNTYVLAIDLGSGGPKVGLVDPDGQVIASALDRTSTYFFPNGGAEQDPNEWWSTVVKTSKKVIQESGVPKESIIAVSVTSLWSVTVAVDEHGEALYNAIFWMDTRGSKYNREITKGFPNIEGYQITKLLKYIEISGLPPTNSGVDALAHMLFIKHERPEVYRKTHKFLEPMDFINLRLTGKVAGTKNTVWPMVLTDNRHLDTLEYDPWLMKMAGIDRAKLPDLLPIDGILGPVLPSVAEELGLAPNTVVVVGVNDNCTAAIGAGALVDYEAAAVLGTSGFMALHVPYKKTDPNHMITTMPSGIKNRYLLWAELGNNGKVLDSYLGNFVYCQDAFGTGQITSDMYKEASAVVADTPPGSEGVIFLPWFNGSLSPREDPTMRGGFLNLSHKVTRKHMTRAVFEGIAMNWRWLRGPVERIIGRKFTHWRLTGGGALSDVWAQIMADVVGIPMHQQVDPRNSNVLGTAFLAFNRLGLIDMEDIPNKIKFARVFEPCEENRSIYDRIFEQFLASYKNIKPVYRALNRT